MLEGVREARGRVYSSPKLGEGLRSRGKGLSFPLN